MEVLKVLKLLIVVFITSGENCEKPSCEEGISFVLPNEKLVVSSGIQITETAFGYEIMFNDSAQIRRLSGLVNPMIELCLKGNKFTAIGVPVPNSVIPGEYQFYYGQTRKNTIHFWDGNTIILNDRKKLKKKSG